LNFFLKFLKLLFDNKDPDPHSGDNNLPIHQTQNHSTALHRQTDTSRVFLNWRLLTFKRCGYTKVSTVNSVYNKITFLRLEIFRHCVHRETDAKVRTVHFLIFFVLQIIQEFLFFRKEK